ncbi:O-antigen polysaccharide polymerase Wzy [Dialister succinatiphilus]
MLDFGTEFSFIAETYMNFSWLGCVVLFIILLFFAQYIWAVYRFK